MNKTLLLPLMLALTHLASAQTLPELINQTLEHNYNVKIVRNDLLIAENNNTAGNAGMLPTVTADGSFSRNINNTRQQFFITEDRIGTNAQTDNLNARLLANWTIFNGFRVQSQLDQLQYLEELSASDMRFFIEQTVSDLAGLYYQLVQETSLLKSYRKALDVSRYRLKIERQRKQTGSGNALSFNQALIDYQNDSALTLMSSSSIRTLETQLNTLSNRELTNPILLPISESGISIDANAEELQSKALAGSTDMKRAMLVSLISETNADIAQSGMYPEVNIFGGYAFSKVTNEVGFLKSSRNFGPEFGVNVRFNLFNGGQVKREIENSSIVEGSSNYSAEQVKLELRSAVVVNYENHTSLESRLNLARQNAEIANETLRIAQRQLEQGVINGLDFRQYQLEVIRAETTIANLERAKSLSALNLLRLSGELIERLMS